MLGRIPFISLLLAIIHTSAGLLILIFSSWFIAACALVPANFNYMLPAVIIRGLALVRIGAGYGHMWLAHHDLLGRTTWLRSELFSRLKDKYLPTRAGDVERLATQTETLSSIWVGWVAHQASAVVLIVLSVAIVSSLALPGTQVMWMMALSWMLLTGWLVFYGLRIAQKQVQQETDFRFQSEHFLSSSSLWHMQLKEHQGKFPSAPDLRKVWRDHQRIESAGQWALWCMQGLSIVGLLMLFILNDNQGFHQPTSLIVPMLLLSITDWLGRPLTTAAHFGRYRKANEAVQLNEGEALPDVVGDEATHHIGLKDFQSAYLTKGMDAELPAKGLVILSGPSGCGKSSLLLALAGMTQSRGSLFFDGKPVKAGRRKNWIYVEQSPVILEATLKMNLAPNNRQLADDDAQQALSLVGLGYLTDLEAWLGKGGRRLSGGEARRLSLARTWLANPAVWLIDEPFEGLDQDNIEGVAHSLIAQSKTSLVIVATHVLPDVVHKESPVLIKM
ncbi:ATP-binding cassette domain-containing protein [Alteromonas sp. C1M14]|uniref:ATP-binding cassette domain-containing protein n=1 Tax=Alteromonas sp. C1M14 TaxID=2841567 RepID=UPI001C0A350F|nr:ATP-binding cassette domain-containing protein [Alteromonas sp. C1M14]MBU2978107.1 ATP-binding cassette domain-containing protein [Alteromonas sp. C1M14]